MLPWLDGQGWDWIDCPERVPANRHRMRMRRIGEIGSSEIPGQELECRSMSWMRLFQVACGGDAVRGTRPVGVGGGGPPPGASEGAGEPRGPLDGPDGVRRAPRGADGQQHGGAVGTR